MLGLLHRTILGKGPSHFKEFFRVGADGKLVTTSIRRMGPLAKRSALGFIPIYNLLPGWITSAKSVSLFQSRLQMELKMRAEASLPEWPQTYSPRMPLDNHPLDIDGDCVPRPGGFISVVTTAI